MKNVDYTSLSEREICVLAEDYARGLGSLIKRLPNEHEANRRMYREGIDTKITKINQLMDAIDQKGK